MCFLRHLDLITTLLRRAWLQQKIFVMVEFEFHKYKSLYLFLAYVERSQDEIYFPNYGIGISPKNEGSYWSNGFLVRPCPEYPLHFTVGMVGCAFSILLNHYLKFGDETESLFMKKIGENYIFLRQLKR